ncbi:MAG: hypothetical protein RLY16_791 [Bacteroidota bacterium]|jgi:ring-1,2-phenylacetyl-CoA epoxidase subunit PaaD
MTSLETELSAGEQLIWQLIESIPDPEIPVLSIVDLGIIRGVSLEQHHDLQKAIITITPTYTGCPAMDMIGMQIKTLLVAEGFELVEIQQTLSPAWTTDMMSENGKEQLRIYGIAPPDNRFKIPQDGVTCPQCQSSNTRVLSEFGSTACKALYQCNDCKEPFDYFKCH